MIKTLMRRTAILCLLGAVALAAAPLQARDLPDFVPLVEKHSPAVVNISTSRKVSGPEGFGHPPLELPEGLPEDSPFGDLFRHFFGEGGPGVPRREFDSESLGSGFILSRDGYVVTNHHVVKDAEAIEVRLSDRRTFEAEVVGSDPKTDIALLRIDARDLPILELGDSRDVKVGEWVLAIGSPFGFDHSVTAGIVSAKGRSLPSESYVPFIQTDVAINPGNSGGPLFNLDGEVIGINSQIYSRTGGFMGLSFAIPAEVARDVVDQIREKGHVTRGWLGVLIQEVTRELADSLGMDRPTGALVAQVLPDSPAKAAGLQAGDVIISFNGHEIPRSAALPPVVGAAPVGEGAEVEILRDGEPMTLEVTIEELPEEEKMARGPAQGSEPAEEDRGLAGELLGMEVAPIPAEVRERLELPEGGVLVTDVTAGPAARAGIFPGDVLLMINHTALESPDQLEAMLEELPRGRVARVLVQRERGPIWLPLEIPE
ncbi:serine protease Do [Ectothiorhodospira mobilis]|uniref:Probable periplasmic serine endoprotease DegP-like n=2 Tax=Ectothiorhodospira mobilis TaxID=195064 RepID=A0A1I4RSH7_ECTMO|nr:DegQ family serine endoprotease [Ectothiorhodospira mobilis]SFM55175.1 serine protease Do [Ectothiorhodospira mobilis]